MQVRSQALFRGLPAALVLLAAWSWQPSAALSQGQGAGERRPARHYYDGGSRREVIEESGEVAEFAPQEETRKQIQAARKEAREVAHRQERFVRLWKVPPEPEENVVRALSLRAPRGKFSPVFRDSPGGARRALVGGVLVALDPSWSEKQVKEWARGHGYAIGAKLPTAKRTYLLDTPPGLPSLEEANKLQESGEVVSATPNWWQEVQAK